MGQLSSKTDFEWVYTEEPHATRRKQILAKYPEVKDLFGADRSMMIIVPLMFCFQMFMAWMLKDATWPFLILCTYAISGTINHSLFLAMHENSHNTVFGYSSITFGRLFGCFINLATGFPISVSFKKYHMDHHKFMGDEVYDTDIPSEFECKLFNRTITKLLWIMLNPVFYTLRPLFGNPKPITIWEIGSFLLQVAFDLMILKFFGPKSLFYIMLGTLLGIGIHPMTGHFISEHYTFFTGQQTTSYYGPLNYIAWNVGYHNEHHDFPWVSYRNLPKLKKLAPEFYDMPSHSSWVKVLLNFVWNKQYGTYSRIKTNFNAQKIQQMSKSDDILPSSKMD